MAGESFQTRVVVREEAFRPGEDAVFLPLQLEKGVRGEELWLLCGQWVVVAQEQRQGDEWMRSSLD